MSRRELGSAHLWVQQGGSGDPGLLLLHGLGASGEVWGWRARAAGAALAGSLGDPGSARAWALRPRRPYSFGHYAADVATLFKAGERVLVLGHSMGGVVGLALASGWFGVSVVGVTGIGIKVE